METIWIAAQELPARLHRVRNLRHGLYVKGASAIARDFVRLDQRRTIAIVGSRAAQTKFAEFARDIASHAARADIIVVSGGALGIDAAAHRGALDAESATLAVLGTGVDVVYPSQHAALFEEIAATGALLSQFTLGSLPLPGCFVSRNEVIAALADAVIVIGAEARSGALHTAKFAAEMKIPVGVVGGASGCDQLLSRGESVWEITSASDAVRLAVDGCLEDLAQEGLAHPAPVGLTLEEAAIWNIVAQQKVGISLAILCSQTGKSEKDIRRIIMYLEVRRRVACVGPDLYIVIHKRKFEAVY